MDSGRLASITEAYHSVFKSVKRTRTSFQDEQIQWIPADGSEFAQIHASKPDTRTQAPSRHWQDKRRSILIEFPTICTHFNSQVIHQDQLRPINGNHWVCYMSRTSRASPRYLNLTCNAHTGQTSGRPLIKGAPCGLVPGEQQQSEGFNK